MARPVKTGLQRFSITTQFYHDIKIRKLIRYQTGSSVSVYICILCLVYDNGYSIQWDEEMPFIISEAAGFEEEFVSKVVSYCTEIGLFDQDMLNKHGVLTSRGIQERYVSICKNLKRSSEINPELNLVNSEETEVSGEETGVIPEETPINPEKSTQYSKVKNSKVKNSNIKGTGFIPPTIEDVRGMVIDSFGLSEEAAAKFAQKFVNWYEGNGWKAGGKKMKDWHRAIKTTWIDTVEDLGAKYPKKQEGSPTKRRYLNDPKPQQTNEP